MQNALVSEEGVILNQVWSSYSSSNAIFFVWRLLLDKVQTKGKLLKRKIILNEEDAMCPLCGFEAESIDHLFFVCSFSTSL